MADDDLRAQALTSLRRKGEFRRHLLVYVLVNGMLTVIWAVTSAGFFFWPIFPMLGWGIGLGFHAWEAYGRQEPSEDRIRREMDRLR